MRPAEPVILFLHIPKTAGLTLREILMHQYARREILITSPEPKAGKLGHRRYVRFLEEGGETPPQGLARNSPFRPVLRATSPERMARLRAVMGHFWFGLHEEIPRSSTYFTVVRDPIDRTLSMYHHRATRHGLSMPVEDYILSERDVHMDNDQVRRLANTDDGDARLGPCTDEIFERALRNLDERFSAIGTTERFDDLLIALGRLFGWERLGYISHNVSRGRPTRETLSAEALSVLTRHNQYDLQLHREANRRLDELVAGLGIDLERERPRLRRQVWLAEHTWPIKDRLRSRVARLRRRRTPPEVRRRERYRSR